MNERTEPKVSAQRKPDSAPAGDVRAPGGEPEVSSEAGGGPEERSDSVSPATAVPDEYFDDDDDRPLPDLPPLPADPRWRVAHLPFLTAVSAALLLCAASAGFLTGGPASALGAATGVLIVTISFTLSTLVIAWADTVRPALLMPLALLTYVLKYSILGVVLAYGVSTTWTGKAALGWGIVAGVMVWTGVQVWWFSRLNAAQSRSK